MEDMYIVCDDITRLVKYMDTLELNPVYERIPPERRADAHNSERTAFTGVQSLDEAIQYLDSGWSDGAEWLTKQVYESKSINLNKPVKRSIYNVIGHNTSVPRYLQGIPTNMIDREKETRKQRVVNLYWDTTRGADETIGSIMKDAANALQVIRLLESNGYRVNLTVIVAMILNTQPYFIEVKIKDSKERLNISKLAFPMVHPAYLRRICFRLIECDPRIDESMFMDGLSYVMSHHAIAQRIDGILLLKNATIEQQIQYLEQGNVHAYKK